MWGDTRQNWHPLSSPRRSPTMDPPSPSQVPQAQSAAPSPLTSYRWHTGGSGEKGAGGFRWGRLAGWGRALSHQEPVVSNQPAPRSLFRRVLSAPPKESRTSRLRLSKTLWGRHKSPPPDSEPEPEAPEPEPEPEPPVPQIPEAPTPDAPIWNIGAFTLLDGRLLLLGGEEEGPRRPRVGSASSEGSIQVAMGSLRDPDRIPGKTEPEAAGPNQVHNVRGLLKRLKEKKKGRSELGANASRDGPPSALGSRESLATLSELDLGAERDVRIWPLHPSLLEEPHCFQVTWAGGSRCFSCRSAAERDRWIEDLRRHFQPSQALVTDLGTAELARSGGREALLFRENTLATKAIDEYMKLVAQDYLQETLGQVVRRLCASTEDCEVDPSKCPAAELPQHQARLQNSCEEVFQNIIHSYDCFPAELGTVFSGWREECKARGSEALGPRLVCASLFLRLLCPAILAPSLFGLAPEHPAPGPARALTLIAKVIQNLANRAPFGEKEAYMGFMNSFLEDHGPAMQHFLDQVAMVDVDAAPSGYQGNSDLALQLAVLHAQLCTIFAELDQATRDSLEPLPTILRAIEEGRPVPVSVPMRLPPPPAQVHSSFSAGEKPGFLAPRDLSKHTPLISKSQSLRSVQGAGSWAWQRPDEERPPRLPRPVQRTQSVPAGRATRRRPSAGPRPRPKGSLRMGPAPRSRPWTGASTSLPRKPSVPWQRQLDQPRDRDQAPGAHRPVGKLAELQCEAAALREEQKKLSGLVESLSTDIRALTEQQEQLRGRLQDLDSRLREGTSQSDPGRHPPSSEDHRLKSLELRLTEMENTQAQLRDAVQSLQLLPRTSGSRSQPLPLKAPCVNGDTT
ncbi:PREDICTED: RAS protein activator like-3 isoform X3 [Ceratotherium simum simum]|uniref:RAS protein activator like-3 isoform X3 n=1 Tax=Ceratotherium simum simum TaxID=73337 RepID=A0ABM1DN45_CERSS|nr:PREDICTED: RAS protein activator like-3 isoform X3 [Ceratotherium simum simum]